MVRGEIKVDATSNYIEKYDSSMDGLSIYEEFSNLGSVE